MIPLERTGKNDLNMLYLISKTVPKDVSSFFKKSENLSNSRLFLGFCNGKTHDYDQVILGTDSSGICVLKKICVYNLCTVHNSGDNAEKNLLSHFGDPPGTPYALYFCRKIYFM